MMPSSGRDILYKSGVTSQDVRRRVADARNDPTFLLASVETVATYELQILSSRVTEYRRKVAVGTVIISCAGMFDASGRKRLTANVNVDGPTWQVSFISHPAPRLNR
jgi:hypothetical protein